MKITKLQLREMIREEIQKLNESSLDYEQDFKWANENELKVISKLIWMNPQGIAGVIKMGKKKPAEFKKLIKQMAKKGLGESINEAVRVLAIKEGVKTSKAFNNFQKSRSSFLERWGKLKKQLNTIKTESPNNEYLRLEKQLYKFETAFIEHSAKIMSSVSKISKSNLTESVNEAKYKGYDWKRQNRKDGHPLIVPALQKTFANMKDLKKYIDKHGTMESVNEVKLTEDYKNSEWEVYVADENGKEKIVKKAKSKRAGVILYNKLINSDKYHEVGMRVVKESVNEGGMGILDKDQTDVLHGIVMKNKSKNSKVILSIVIKDKMFKGVDKKELLGYIEGAKQFVKYMKSESVNEGNLKYVIQYKKDKNRYLSNKSRDVKKVKDALQFKSEKDAKNQLNGLDWQFRGNYKIVKLKESVNEKISKDEWSEYPKYARKLKPYMQKLLKVPLKVRVIKQANHNPWIEVRVARFGKDVIPNDFRLKAAKVIGATSIKDKSNVNYGNIRSNSVSMKHDQWVKLLGRKV